jgi:hypothetical protein
MAIVAPGFPPLPNDLVEFVEGGVSLLTGTCSTDLVPESVRSAGLRVWPCACKLTVLLPKATAEIGIENLRTSRRIALTASRIETYRTVQIKGTVLDIRDGDEADRALSIRYGAGLRKALAWVGIPEGVTSGLSLWPAWAVDVDIVHVFAQTPGPLAGVRMPIASGGGLP